MLQNLIDQNLNINSDLESQIQHVINVALLCVHTIPTRRPSMMHVLAMLLGEKEVEVTFRESLSSKKNYSFMSKSSTQSSNANLVVCNTNCSSELPNGNNGLVELETSWILDRTWDDDTFMFMGHWTTCAMICTLHNTFVLSFFIDLPRIILKTRFFKSSSCLSTMALSSTQDNNWWR